jgi:hypothetical protein
MAVEKFRLPRSSYDQLSRIIQSYGQFNVEATLDEVAKIATMQRTVVSGNNGFLADTGVLTGGNKKVLTDRGRELSRALEYDNQEEIRRVWRESISEADFFHGVLSAVRIRRGMEPSNLQSHIAYSAGLGKNKGVMTGAACVIDILQIAGLLREEEGKLVALSPDEAEELDHSVAAPTVTAVRGESPSRAAVVDRPATRKGSDVGTPIQIQIQIQCKAAELEGLAPKVRALLDELAASDEPAKE